MKTIIFDLDGTLVQLKPNLVCFADVGALAQLRKRYNFALVSGSRKTEIMWALNQTGLRSLFDDNFIVALEDTNIEKSSGKPFQEMRNRLQGEMVMLGDSPSDEAGSAIAGLPFVKVKTCSSATEQRDELAKAIILAQEIIEKGSRFIIELHTV